MTAPRAGRAPRWSALDLVEAYQLAHAVAALQDLALLAPLARPRTARSLARLRGLDEPMLHGLLAYLAARTDLVRRTGDRFAATASYTAGARYLIDLYAGAFAGNAIQLPRLLRVPTQAARAVDRRKHARAFAQVARSRGGVVPVLLHQLGLDRVLDLGCGAADLLIEAAARDPAFVGWGLELHSPMRRLARARLRDANLDRRVRILAGDFRRLGAVPARLRADVQTITMCQVANEMFGDGGRRFARWIGAARRLFPGRLLLISDYYGRLGISDRARDRSPGRIPGRTHGRAPGSAPGLRETLLHDYAQLISGQGVPPASAAAWRALYDQAGARLLHVVEDRGTTRFVHLVRL